MKDISAKICFTLYDGTCSFYMSPSKSSTLMLCHMMDLNFTIESYVVEFNGKSRAPSYFGTDSHFSKWKVNDDR